MSWKLLASLHLTALLLILGIAGWGAAQADDARPRVRMVNPAIDAEGPWCFLAKPNGQLGIPGGRRGAQVTFDGAINTPGIELVFLTGEPLRPIMARQKTLLDGYIPVIQYGWNNGSLEYAIEALMTIPSDEDLDQSFVLARVIVANKGSEPSPVRFGVAARHTGMDHRFEGQKAEPFSPDWQYEIKDDILFRDGKAMVVYPRGMNIEAVPGMEYKGPFKGRDLHLTERTEFGLARSGRSLAPGASAEFVFVLPMKPVLASDTAALHAMRTTNFAQAREQVIHFWNSIHRQNAPLLIPEPKVQDAQRASLTHFLQAIYKNPEGEFQQGVNKFQYNWFWLRDGAYLIRAHDVLGQHEWARRVLVPYTRYQQEDGRFESQRGQLDGFGQALFTMGQHAIITGDMNYAEQIWRHYPPAVEWLKRARAADPMGLMPRTEARDNELIIGHYTGHNFWALLGLRTAIRIARMTEHQEEAADWLAYYNEFEAHFFKELEKVAGRDGYIPPGLDAEGGQDWGNLIGVYPAEVLAPDDPRLTTTLARMHAEKIEEGLMTYLGRLHHYLTVKEAQNHVARGEQEEDLHHFYAILVHMDSSHAMFEWQAEVWGSRDVDGNFPPHGWGAAMYNLLLRNMLVREAGGRGGLEPRDLHLFSVVSPEWAKPGQTLGVQNAPTEAGPITATMKFSEYGAMVEINYSTPPVLSSSRLVSQEKPVISTWTPARSIVLHIPYFAALESFTSDVPPLERRVDALVFPPNVKKVELKWTRRDVEPLSFEKAVADYKAEYARRFAEYVKAGGVPLPVQAPPLLTADERRTMFNDLYGTPTVGLAVGKPVTTSAPHEENHRPELAVDGNARDRNGSSWWAAPPAPQWLQIDLEEPTEIAAVHVYPYWDGSRYYQYVVDVSLDGKEWTRVADRSEAVDPESAMGHRHEFAPRLARYVRVTMLYNSANPSLHLVEVRVFGPDEVK